jgi:hypothetical protein
LGLLLEKYCADPYLFDGLVVDSLIIGECNKQVKQLLQPAGKKTVLNITMALSLFIQLALVFTPFSDQD